MPAVCWVSVICFWGEGKPCAHRIASHSFYAPPEARMTRCLVCRSAGRHSAAAAAVSVAFFRGGHRRVHFVVIRSFVRLCFLLPLSLPACLVVVIVGGSRVKMVVMDEGFGDISRLF